MRAFIYFIFIFTALLLILLEPIQQIKMQNPVEQQQQLPANIDFSKLPDIQCKVCRGTIFKNRVRIKTMSAIQSPTGRETQVFIQVLICEGCLTPIGEEKRPE